MDNHVVAQQLNARLHLERPPVGLAFVQEPPSHVARAAPGAPSACTFWRLAEHGVFYADAADHRECPIGLLTMGFPASEADAARAQQTVQLFAELDYFSPDEVANLPTVSTPHAGIVYGPLADLPCPPDVVLVLVSPAQAMLLAESAGSTALRQEPELAAMGRPACAAIPRALRAGQTTLSLGCIGARTYAAIPDDRLLVAIPADRLDAIANRLDVLAKANDALGRLHADKRQAVDPAAAVSTTALG